MTARPSTLWLFWVIYSVSSQEKVAFLSRQSINNLREKKGEQMYFLIWCSACAFKILLQTRMHIYQQKMKLLIYDKISFPIQKCYP